MKMSTGFSLVVTLAASLWLTFDNFESAGKEGSNSSQKIVSAKGRLQPGQTVPQLAVDEEIAVLRHGFSELKDELADLRKVVMQQGMMADARVTQADGGLSSMSAEDIERITDETIHEAELRQYERLEAINRALLSETVDSSWAEQAEQSLSHAIADESFHEAELQNLDCRSTLCRIEVQHRHVGKSQEFGLLLSLAVAAELPQMTMQQAANDDGTVSTIFYFARDGYDFPG